MQNRWNESQAKATINQYKNASKDVALRVYTSRLIGIDPKLVLHGGGNTSVKSITKNALGEKINVLYVKGSGWDLDTLEPPGLPGVKLDTLIKLRNLNFLSDEDMVNEQRINLLDAASPNPSVETLLHAFLPHKFIDHSHADAILVIANQPNAKTLCEKIYGETMGIVPYIMPGFDLAKAAAEVYENNPEVKGLILVNHGLFTFGETAKESYDRHIDAVQQAENFINSHDEKKLSPINSKPIGDEKKNTRVNWTLFAWIIRRRNWAKLVNTLQGRPRCFLFCIKPRMRRLVTNWYSYARSCYTDQAKTPPAKPKTFG